MCRLLHRGEHRLPAPAAARDTLDHLAAELHPDRRAPARPSAPVVDLSPRRAARPSRGLAARDLADVPGLLPVRHELSRGPDRRGRACACSAARRRASIRCPGSPRSCSARASSAPSSPRSWMPPRWRRSAGEPYALVWRTRFFSNVLTELVLVPSVVFVAHDGWSRMRRASAGRRVEGALLTAAITAVVVMYFVAPLTGSGPARSARSTCRWRSSSRSCSGGPCASGRPAPPCRCWRRRSS